MVQKSAFNDELAVLRQQNPQNITLSLGVHSRGSKTVKKSSSIYQLDPYLGKDGVLHVGD